MTLAGTSHTNLGSGGGYEMKRIWLVTLFILLLFVTVSFAETFTYYQDFTDDFEDQNLTDGSPMTYTSVSGNLEIDSSRAYSGSYSLGDESGTSKSTTAIDFNTSSDGNTTISIRFNINTQGASAIDGFLNFYPGSNGAGNFVAQCGEFSPSNEFKCDVGGVDTTITTYNTDTWYKLTVEHDPTENTVTYYLYDDSNVLQGSLSGAETGAGEIKSLAIFADPHGGGTWFDDLEFTRALQTDPIGITADFDYEISPPNESIDLVDATTDTNSDIHVILSDWNWYVDTTLESTDQNFTLTNVTPNTDYNVALSVCGNYDGNEYCDYTEQNINSGRFYGLLHVTTTNEATGTALDDVTLTFDSNTYEIDSDRFIDLNFLGTDTTTKTLTFTKTGFGTRYFQADFNRFTDFNVPMLMLSSTSGLNVEFQVYESDQTSLYTNTLIRVFNHDKDNNYVGQKTTDSQGKTSFFINPNDENYTMRIFGSDSTVDYNAMTLTVNKPIDEVGGSTITGNWQMNVGGLAWQDYNNVSGNQSIQIYSDTENNYRLTIQDVNGDYFARKYFVNYLGGTSSATLQPYLAPTSQSVSTTIHVNSSNDFSPIPNVEIKIYKVISGQGRSLVEQVVTDTKGEALVSLEANEEYEFEKYFEGALVGTDDITATSTDIYLTINDYSVSVPTVEKGMTVISWTPSGRTRLKNSDTALTQQLSYDAQGTGINVSSTLIIVTNTDINGISGNDLNIYYKTYAGVNSFTNSIDLNYSTMLLDSNTFDNNGNLVVHVQVTYSNGDSANYSKTYKPVGSFDLIGGLTTNFRSAIGCTTNPQIPCTPLLLAAIFMSIIFTISLAKTTSFTNSFGAGAMFIVFMGLFTFLQWVPTQLFLVIAVGGTVFLVALGSRTYGG